MINSYLKLAFRNFWRHRLFSAINLVSLVLCLTSVVVILLLVNKLVTFDDFHEKGDRLFSLAEGHNRERPSPGTVFPVADLIREDFPEIESISRILEWETYMLSHGGGDWSISPEFVDPDFLQMFSFPLKYGSIESALKETNNIVLSDAMALRVFGDENPVGREIKWNDSLRLTVSGVLQLIPGASSMRFQALMAMDWLKLNNPYFRTLAEGWDNRLVQTYVLLKKETHREDFEKKLGRAAAAYYPKKEMESELGLILYKDVMPMYEPQIGYYIGGLRIIVVFLVLIAAVNLINLNSAAALYRVREIGVRNVLGSLKSQVMLLFMTETFLLISASLVISLALVSPLVRYFNREVLTEFSVDFIWRMDYPVVLQICLLFILLAFLATWIPARKLLRTPLSLSLKGQAQQASGNNPLQQTLIVLQFVLAIVFVFLTLAVQQQMRYLKQAKLGFEKDEVLVVDTYLGFKDGEAAYRSLNQAIQGLDGFQDVQHYTVSRNIPGRYGNWFNTLRTKDEKAGSKEVYCRVSYQLDSAYFSTYGIRFLAGSPLHAKDAFA